MLLDPIRSVIDFSSYKEIPQRSFLRALAYLAYLGFFFSACVTAVLYMRVNPVIVESAEWLAASMPALTFANGRASSSLTAPLLLRHPRDSRLGILIDTGRTAPVSYDELAKQDALLCLTQNSFYILDSRQHKLEERSFAEMKTARTITVSGDFYRKLAGYAVWMFPILLPILWFFFFFWKLLAAFFYSLAGLAIGAAVSAELDFQSILKLAVYAQTPWIFLQAVMLSLRRPIPGFALFLMGLLVTCVYLWQAIRQFQPPAEPAGG